MISEDTIERVRQTASITRVVGERVKLQQRGRYHVGLCPFHKEKTPSFHVNDERGFYKCFGCGASGDAIKFMREHEGLEFIEAVRYLAEREGIEIKETGSDQDRREQASARKRKEELYEAGNLAATYFERMLREHPLRALAEEELERRGLVASSPTGPIADALQAFRIGYAPYAWDGLTRHLAERGTSPRASESVGLLVPRKSGPGHYDRFRNRLMFAVIDLQGRVIAFSGRALREPTEGELGLSKLPPLGTTRQEEPAKYVNSPESPVYRKREAAFGLWQARSAARSANECVVVEGNFDVVSLHARGIQNVVAPLGTAFTPEQAKQIRRFTDRVTLFFDGDNAGRRAVLSARASCQEIGLSARVATLPDGQDPDDLVRSEAGPEGVRRILKAGRGLLEYLIDSTLDRFEDEDAQGKASKVEAIRQLLRSEQDPTVRNLARKHADATAARLNISDGATIDALERSLQEAGSRLEPGARREDIVAPPERARSRNQRSEIDDAVLGLILDFPELLQTPEGAELADLAEGDLVLGLLVLRRANQTGVAIDPEDLVRRLPENLAAPASRRLAAPKHDALEPALTELRANLRHLRKQRLGQEKSETVEELHDAMTAGDAAQEDALLNRLFHSARKRLGVDE